MLPFTQLVVHSTQPLVAVLYGAHFELIDRVSGQSLFSYSTQNPSEHAIMVAALARNGRRLALSTTEKKFLLVDCDANGKWSASLECDVPKRVSCVTFTADNRTVFFADKFGDGYSIGPDDKTPQLRMGHVSMITDLTFINDDSRLITAERDEKIRITHYPQTHVIDRFLFGHKEYIKTLLVPGFAPKRLLSAGGDDQVLAWTLEGDCGLLSSFALSEIPEVAAKDGPFCVRKLVNTSKHILMLVERFPQLFVLSFEGDQLKLQSTVALPSAPLDISCDDQDKVWLAMDTESEGQLHAICFQWDESSHLFRTVLEEEEPSLRSLKFMQKEVNVASTKQLPFYWQDKVLRKFCFPNDATATEADGEALDDNINKKART